MAKRAQTISRIGLVIHPTRDVEEPLAQIGTWAREQGVALAQLPFADERLHLPETCSAGDCDVVVAIGGDGTTLAAIHLGAAAGRAVMGVACGSLGALTTVPAGEVRAALERFAVGDWAPRELPALRVSAPGESDLLAFNDVALIRDGAGQLRVSATVDGALYARLAGDGCVVSTAAGSAAYTIAAGGPLLTPTLLAFVLTRLPTHGGFSPPLVLGESAQLALETVTSHGGGRLEIDGRVESDAIPEHLTIILAPDAARLVAFSDQESHLTGLRRRGIVTDSPRILAEDQRG